MVAAAPAAVEVGEAEAAGEEVEVGLAEAAGLADAAGLAVEVGLAVALAPAEGETAGAFRACVAIDSDFRRACLDELGVCRRQSHRDRPPRTSVN